MFESINSSPSQTRAEISDIATAIYSGVDATMLSAESALGQYPFEAVSIMSRTVAHVVSEPYCQRWLGDDKKRTTIDAISAAAKNTAEYSCATTIVLFTDNYFENFWKGWGKKGIEGSWGKLSVSWGKNFHFS